MEGVTQEQVITVLIGAIIALFIGYFIGRRGAPGSAENRKLQSELDSLRDERARYEQRVNTHFAETAGKLNALTENYREVYEQIAEGAAALCSSGSGARFDALAAPTSEDDTGDTIEGSSVQVEPPRDYAPKSSPDEPGVLNERFGIDGADVPPDGAKASP
ncbi:MAG: YhcB family protein [Pseudomonadota bacterium]